MSNQLKNEIEMEQATLDAAEQAGEKVAEVVTDTLQKIEDGVVTGYKKIEDSVVSGYKKIEDGVVGGFNKMTDKIVEKVFAKDGESVEEAKARLNGERND